MNTHKVEIILTEDGTLTLRDLPFQAAEAVEVIIYSSIKSTFEENPTSLHGSVTHYDQPFDAAVSLDAWEALK